MPPVQRRVRVLEHDLQRRAGRSRAACRASGRAARPPGSTTEPGSGAISPSSTRASVVLPLPDSPTRPSVSPRCTLKSTPASAWTVPTRRKVLRQLLDARVTGRRCALGRQRRASTTAWPAAGRAPARGSGSARSAASPTSKYTAAARCGSGPARARSAARTCSRSRACAGRGQEAGNGVQPVAGPCAARAAGCSAAARPCTGAAGRRTPAERRSLLDQLAGVQHAHPVAHLGDHAPGCG